MIGFKSLARKTTNLLLALALVSAQLFAPLSAIVPKAAAVNNAITASTHQGQSKTAGVLGGYTSGNIVEYTESDSINYRFNIDSDDPASGQMQVEFTSNDTGCLFFDGSFVLGTHDGSATTLSNVTGTAPTVTLNGGAINDGDDWIQLIDVEFTSEGSATVNYYLTLSDEAGECSSGSPQHSRLANSPSTGDFKNIGNQNVPIPASQIIELPEIFVEKWVDTNADGTVDRRATAGEWSFTLDGTTTLSTDANGKVTFTNVKPDGNHTITESTGPAGQSFLSGSGTRCMFVGSTATANVQSGTTSQDATCIFNNGVSPGKIKIVKNAIPNNLTDFAFTATGTGVTDFTLDDDSGVTGADATYSNEKEFTGLAAGEYSFTEAVVAGWDLTAITCPNVTVTKDLANRKVTIDLAAGQEVTCTFENKQRGQIIVTKQTLPDGDTTEFPVTITGNGTIHSTATQNVTDGNSVTYSVSHGTFDVNETVPSGWSVDESACQDLVINGNTPLVSGIPTRSCTITNTKLATLIIIKNALPDHEQDFAFTTSGTGLSSFSLDDDSDGTLQNQVTFSNLTPNQQYSVTEQPTPGWSLTGLSCNDVVQQGSTATVTPTPGQTITCTFTNTKLISVSGTKFKVDAGATDGGLGTVLGGWTIFIDSNNNGVLDEGELSDVTDENGDYGFSDLLYGTTVTLREVLRAGWTQIFGPATFTLDGADDVTDKDFGNFENASINGFKWNDADADDVLDADETKLNGWTITLYNDGTDDDTALDDVVSSTVTAGANATLGSYTFTNLVPGTYAVCETQQTGWIQTYPDNNACHTIVINESGESNQANFGNQGRGSIQVNKNVDTDGDGDIDEQGATDWTWDLGTADFATGSSQNVAAGNYNVHEDQKTDYHFTSVTCTRNGQNFTVTQAETTAVTVNAGDTIVCTYLNTRNTGTIEVRKSLNPTNDTGVFDLRISGTTHKEDATHDDTTGAVQVVTGNYDVSELAGNENTDLANYSTKLTCTKNGQELLTNIATTDSDNFAVATGDAVVCTFTNTRYGHIIIEKQTLPDGSTQSFEFDTSYDFANFPLTDGQQNDSGNLLPGEYSVSEENIPNGWDLTNVTCSDRSSVTAIDLSAGETVTCVFTNTQRGSITIIKDTQPDSDQEFRFTGSLGDSENEETPNFTLVDDGVDDITDRRLFEDLTPGTYTVTEPNVTGWTLESITCEGGVDAAQDKENNRNAVINLAAGEDVTCTFVNTRDTGSIKVNKLLDDDGDEVFETTNPEIFTWSIDGTGTNAMGSTVSGVETDQHSINENTVAGYHFVGWFPGNLTDNDFTCNDLPEGEASISLPALIDVVKDQTTEITLCNARDTGTITVNKNVDMNADGDTDDEEDIVGATDWTWDLGTADFATGSTQEVVSGDYTIHEDQKVPDYEFVSVSCVNNQEQTVVVDQAEEFEVTIANGDSLTCTFTNRKKPVALTLVKTNDRPAPTVVGDTVTYTLTVTVPDTSGTVYNATVTDIPPEGFEYIPGSETATTGSLTKTYASPGQWSLGDLTPGSIVTLTYRSRILDTVSAGTYPDIAYAEGCDTEAIEGDCEVDVYSNVTNLNEDGTPFVGTRVTIRSPQVLGASTTVLVNTGAADIWRNLAVGTLLMGAALATLYRRGQKGGRA